MTAFAGPYFFHQRPKNLAIGTGEIRVNKVHIFKFKNTTSNSSRKIVHILQLVMVGTIIYYYTLVVFKFALY